MEELQSEINNWKPESRNLLNKLKFEEDPVKFDELFDLLKARPDTWHTRPHSGGSSSDSAAAPKGNSGSSSNSAAAPKGNSGSGSDSAAAPKGNSGSHDVEHIHHESGDSRQQDGSKAQAHTHSHVDATPQFSATHARLTTLPTLSPTVVGTTSTGQPITTLTATPTLIFTTSKTATVTVTPTSTFTTSYLVSGGIATAGPVAQR
jgi:hypothetical protein